MRFRMPIQWKIVFLVILAVSGVLASVVWKTQTLVREDKISFIKDSSMKQIAPLKRLVQERIDEHKARLVSFAASRTNLGAGKAKTFGDFEIVSMVQPSQVGQWSPVWIEKSMQAAQERWPRGFEITLLKSLPYARVKDGEALWVRVSDPQGSPVYAILVSVEMHAVPLLDDGPIDPGIADHLPESIEYGMSAPAGSGKKAIVVGFASLDPMASVADDFIGSTSTVFLVDERGYVASHVNKAYVGALFTEDPLVKELVKTRKTMATGEFEDLESRPVIGHFERIDRTNLYAVITTPMRTASAFVELHLKTALGAAGFSIIVALFLAWSLGRRIAQPIQAATAMAVALKEGQVREVLHPIHTNDEIGDLTTILSELQPSNFQNGSKEEVESSEGADVENRQIQNPSVLGGFNRAFIDFMKEPLLAILGHAQLAKSKIGEETRPHAESIEREARRAKDLIERVREWDTKITGPNDESSLMEPLDLKDALESALEDEQAILVGDGIEIKKDFAKVPKVRVSSERFRLMVEQIIGNAREAMLARPNRKLTMILQSNSKEVTLKVKDSGIGMSRVEAGRAFEPFFKGFESPTRTGLGLTFVAASMEKIGGRVSIESSPGEGATITLVFEVRSAERQAFIEEHAREMVDAAAAHAMSSTEVTPAVTPAVTFMEAGASMVADGVEEENLVEIMGSAAIADMSDVTSMKEPFVEEGKTSNAAGFDSHLSFLDDEDDDEPWAVGPAKAGSVSQSVSAKVDLITRWDQEEKQTAAPVRATTEIEIDDDEPIFEVADLRSPDLTQASDAPGTFEVKIRKPKVKTTDGEAKEA